MRKQQQQSHSLIEEKKKVNNNEKVADDCCDETKDELADPLPLKEDIHTDKRHGKSVHSSFRYSRIRKKYKEKI